MLPNLRLHFVAWLIERHPHLWLARKKLTHHRIGEDREFLSLHARSMREGRALQRVEERYNLWTLARTVAARPGAYAEVGVYRGGSARFLCAAKGAAPLHLFDTFQGMPATNPATDGHFQPGEFGDGTLARVRAYLTEFPNVHFHPGVFPSSVPSSSAVASLPFKFVHLDVDLYLSTLHSLEWFYPRLTRGGVLVSHDYGVTDVPGVKRAFDEFFRDKPEVVVPLWFSQAMIVKL
jgi:hypothetical protein